MKPDPIWSLTDAQQEVLRLVARGFETKEIAAELSISPAAVVDRIEGARRKLGGVRRAVAARRLIEHEKARSPNAIGGDPNGFAVSYSTAAPDTDPVVNGDDVAREERSAFTWAIPTEPIPASFVDRHPILAAILGTLAILAILTLVKPVVDGVEWVFNAVAPTFAKRGWNDGQTIGGCGRGTGQRHAEQSPGGQRGSPNDRCNLRREGGRPPIASGRR